MGKFIQITCCAGWEGELGGGDLALYALDESGDVWVYVDHGEADGAEPAAWQRLSILRLRDPDTDAAHAKGSAP
jgi:hypothetical protein